MQMLARFSCRFLLLSFEGLNCLSRDPSEYY